MRIARFDRERDLTALWRVFVEICEAGDSYPQAPTITEEEFAEYWLGRGGEQWTALDGDGAVGGYTLRENHPGRGSHVATASYIVAEAARGHGLGRALGEHSLERAREMGFEAMQFNLVVSTNARAVELWKRLGFAVVGRLPGGFAGGGEGRGRVDAFVMHRWL